MYTDVLRAIVGIEVFPVVSLVLFVLVFSAVLVWAARADRTQLNRHAAIPLEGTTTSFAAPEAADQRLS